LVILTSRQVEILRLVAKGKTSEEISRNLRISEVTVKWHIGNAMRRLSASSRAEAVATAMQLGLL
jgi:two-component system, NarL family, response regulator DevR